MCTETAKSLSNSYFDIQFGLAIMASLLCCRFSGCIAIEILWTKIPWIKEPREEKKHSNEHMTAVFWL